MYIMIKSWKPNVAKEVMRWYSQYGKAYPNIDEPIVAIVPTKYDYWKHFKDSESILVKEKSYYIAIGTLRRYRRYNDVQNNDR